jgi:hypothetical protein
MDKNKEEEDGETKKDEKEKDEMKFNNNDERIHFVCTHENGVGCRNSRSLDDRCDPPLVAYTHDLIIGTLSKDEKWIHIIQSEDQEMIGTYLPMSIDDEIFFEKITSNIEWRKKKKRRKKDGPRKDGFHN